MGFLRLRLKSLQLCCCYRPGSVIDTFPPIFLRSLSFIAIISFILQVWYKIQVVVQQVLEEYLADKSMKRQHRSGNLLSNDIDVPAATAEKLDINAYFNRRRPNQKKVIYFQVSF